MNQITLTGMVLLAAPVGDYDKRLVVLTKERGKITVFAKGSRRPNSPYVAGTRPFSFGEFTVYQSKDAYTLTGINIKNYFDHMSLTLDRVYYGMYFMEFASYFSKENLEAKDTLNLLYATFNIMAKDVIPYTLIRNIFELKMFVISGEHPDFFRCMGCDGEKELTHFSATAHGSLCEKCSLLKKDAISLETSTFYTLQYVVSSSISKLYTFNVNEDVLKEFTMVMERIKAISIDTTFKSLEMLI